MSSFPCSWGGLFPQSLFLLNCGFGVNGRDDGRKAGEQSGRGQLFVKI